MSHHHLPSLSQERAEQSAQDYKIEKVKERAGSKRVGLKCTGNRGE